MNLEENFKHHSKKYLFSNDKFLSNRRQNIFEKIKLKKFDKKNNESLKNISISDLTLFNYHYLSFAEKPSVKLIAENNYKIHIVNGICENYEDSNIKIYNISSSDSKNFINIDKKYSDDIILDINSIFLNSGICFNIKKNSKLKLNLIHNTHENFTVFQNNFFNFENYCEVKIEDEFKLSKNTINNINYDIQANENSFIQHDIFQNFSNSNKLFLTSSTNCEKKSSYNQNTYNFSDGFVRNFHYANLNGEFAKASLKGCFFLREKNLCSIKTHINHNAENCESNQTYRGLLNDFSKANYFSNTHVSDKAQKTEAYQLSKGILLSENCNFFSKPELRIFADDVKCSHGSTIGPVDGSAMFYLRSRGINKNQAMKMIISSFIEEDLKYLDVQNMNRILNHLSNYLDSIL